MSMRTHMCGELSKSELEQTVTVCGWVHRRRDHGGVIFIDLRDHRGLLQVVFNPDQADAFAIADQMRSEYVLKVTGQVAMRPEGLQNTELATGEIELIATEIECLSKAKTPPFHHDETVGEDVRLKYRYIDLRRDDMQKRLRLRHQVVSFIRQAMDAAGFVDVETPILTRATPEGARDYVVPSRTHAGKFFALPQSPQLFKQILMIGGLDKYYQIARCFRDEDLRADRQPDFTQLDLEMSFVEQEDVLQFSESLFNDLFKTVLDVELPNPWPRMSYQEAMQRFGSDKPDLRIKTEFADVADLLKTCDFKVFAAPAQDDACRVVALRIPGGASLSRKQIDDYTDYVARYGAKGLAYIKVNDADAGAEGLQSPILKFIGAEATQALQQRLQWATGDIIFFGADKTKVVNDALGALRVKLGHDLEQIEGDWAPLWVTDFPMFEWDEKSERWQAQHHPFTKPADVEQMQADPANATAVAYDMVLNGMELASGSERIHDSAMQAQVFKTLNISDEEAQSKFGFFLEALKYGTPPHAGIAPGIDRLVSLMAGKSNIREVIAFPKTQTAACLMTEAPGDVSNEQLKDLSIQIKLSAKQKNQAA